MPHTHIRLHRYKFIRRTERTMRKLGGNSMVYGECYGETANDCEKSYGAFFAFSYSIKLATQGVYMHLCECVCVCGRALRVSRIYHNQHVGFVILKNWAALQSSIDIEQEEVKGQDVLKKLIRFSVVSNGKMRKLCCYLRYKLRINWRSFR